MTSFPASDINTAALRNGLSDPMWWVRIRAADSLLTLGACPSEAEATLRESLAGDFDAVASATGVVIRHTG